MYLLMCVIPLIILTMIPRINLLAPFVLFIFTAWSFSLEYIDYPLSNHGLLFKEVRLYNRQHRMRALGLGCGVFLTTSVPVLNFLAMPVAVASATKFSIQTKQESSEN